MTIKIVALLILSITVSSCTSIFFQPSKKIFPATFHNDSTPRPFRIPSFDETPLSAWYFSATKQPAKGIVVQFHGNAENMTTHFNSVYWFASEGFDLITFDYRGYGSSPGEPSMTEVHRDVIAAINFASKLASEKKLGLILIGQSLGGSLLLNALQEVQPFNLKAIVIESGFYSYRQIAREKLGVHWLTTPLKLITPLLISDMYSPGGKGKLQRLPRVPKYLLYSQHDPIVPLHHGEQIYADLSEPKFFWRHAEPGHINAFFIENGKRRAELVRELEIVLKN